MQNRNYREDFALDITETNDRAGGRLGRSLAHRGLSRRKAIRMAVMAAALLAFARPTFGQFTVEPMKLELQVTPGKIWKSVVRIRNVDPNEAHTIDFQLVELTQSEDAQWTIVDPNDPNTGDASRLSSCR